MKLLSRDLKSLLMSAGVSWEGPAIKVSGLSYDSRSVKPGDLFFAMRGAHVDGHKFIETAKDKGAVAALVEEKVQTTLPVVLVKSVGETMAPVASAFYGSPSQRIPVVGITGTNGKTTTTYLLEDILSSVGKKCGVMGTINYRFGSTAVEAPNTTPMAVDVQKFLFHVAEAGGAAVAMEVSSHALAQNRVGGVQFEVGVFTNLTQDHLDFHKNMEAYFDAKAKLFRGRLGLKSIINADDPYGQRLLKELPEALSFSVEGRAELTARDVHCSLSGLEFSLQFPSGRTLPVKTNLLGRHNVANCLSAAGAALALGLSEEDVANGLSRPHAIPGRLERVEAGQPFVIVVDYAHTHDALEKVLSALRDTGPKNLICVFGAGGDRDRTKRPKMGRVAATMADWVFVTSDNPRSEDPQFIVSEIEAGIKQAGKTNYTIALDRKDAIEQALRRAQAGDIVLIAGKGHETYQIVGDQKIHFSDPETARAILTS